MSLAALFTLTILAGVVVGHVGDDAILQAVEHRAIRAEERFADRILSDEKVSQIGATLLPFEGQQFTINTYWNDREPTVFAKRIGDNALIAGAHWQFVRPTGILVARISGIIVYIASDADEKTKGASSALVSALKAADF